MSGCVRSRLAHLVRLSTWTLILVLRTCKFANSDTLKQTFCSWIKTNYLLCVAGSSPLSHLIILVLLETGASLIPIRPPLFDTKTVEVGP